MKKKIIWVFVLAFALDHYTFHYVSGYDAPKATSDSTQVITDTASKISGYD